jgi:hypothetical protein
MKYKMLVLILLLTGHVVGPKRNPERFVHPAAKHGSRRPGEVCVLRQDVRQRHESWSYLLRASQHGGQGRQEMASER